MNLFFCADGCGEQFCTVIQEETILVEELAGISALVGDAGQESVKILVVSQSGVVEEGQEP